MERRDDHLAVGALDGEEPVLQVAGVVILVHADDVGVAGRRGAVGRAVSPAARLPLYRKLPYSTATELADSRPVERAQVAAVEREGDVRMRGWSRVRSGRRSAVSPGQLARRSSVPVVMPCVGLVRTVRERLYGRRVPSRSAIAQIGAVAAVAERVLSAEPVVVDRRSRRSGRRACRRPVAGAFDPDVAGTCMIQRVKL